MQYDSNQSESPRYFLTQNVFCSLKFATVRQRTAFPKFLIHKVVLVALWLGVGHVIERSLVRLQARALSSQLGQLSLPSLQGSKSSTSLHGWG